MMSCRDLMTAKWVVVVLVVFAGAPFARGYTDPYDVYAIIRFYASLGFPQLPGWNSIGGDPCGPPNWQGVQCENVNIIGINLNGMNLSGELNDDLHLFNSIILLDLSNNQIGGSIPSELPITLRSLLVSDNQLIGSMPDNLSPLSQLTNLSLSNNLLTGPIPDGFQELTGLISLDLSGNRLTDKLPSSMSNLSSLTTLHLQDNQLSGTLDVIEDLPLRDLNIENNAFSGPIPNKLRNVPNFRISGNLFNITILPPSEAPSPQLTPKADPNGPSAPQISGKKKYNKTASLLWIGVMGLFVILVLVVGICLYMSRCCRKKLSEKIVKNLETGTNGVMVETHKRDKPLQKSLDQVKKVSKEVPPSLPLLPSERIVADPIITVLPPMANDTEISGSAKLFTIASLQEYTNSFSQGNLIGNGTLGTVYRAQLPSGKLLAVKKLDKAAYRHINDRQFLEMVSSISKLHHENIVELVGYCIEHGQRLLIYNYCRNGTLNEALEYDEEIKKRLSWKDRMHLALQTAKALEYLHEVCEPPIVHRNFKSANVLLDDDLAVQVSDCGLAPLLSSSSMTQLQVCGYGAPELELGSYSYQSDVYSFGVVMLELLTGRKSYDRLRPRGEQYLARWAFSQLHDIDALSRMVDPSIVGAYPSISLSRVADIISLCIQPEPEFRPPMSEIVQKLVHMRQREV